MVPQMRKDFVNSPNIGTAVRTWADPCPDVTADSRLVSAQSINEMTMPATMHGPAAIHGLGFSDRRRSGGAGIGHAISGGPFGSGVTGAGKWLAIGKSRGLDAGCGSIAVQHLKWARA